MQESAGEQMKAPIGALVKLYYDSPRDVVAGDALRTPRGRLYLIWSVRRQAKGKHVGRWHLKAIVMDHVPDGAHVHPIFWYRRNKKRGIKK